MSEWRSIKDDDIDVDVLNKEINIYLEGNDWENVCLIVTFEQLKKIDKTISQMNQNLAIMKLGEL